jgi:dUTP pyrophosphatase
MQKLFHRENRMLKFAKKNNSVKIPTKEPENAGYDIYANFGEEFFELPAHETKLIPTGLYSSLDEEYYIQFFNRGSNGSKGLVQSCGVIDSSYRGEWFVAMTNTNDKDWYIVKESYMNKHPMLENAYPYEKAICQFVILSVPKLEIKEVTLEELCNDTSIRNDGKLGSSGK